jgi:hypothetical protein
MRRPIRRRRKPEHSFDHYTEPSWKGVIAMLIVSMAGIILAWLAYSWALNQPGVPAGGDVPSSPIVRVLA